MQGLIGHVKDLGVISTSVEDLHTVPEEFF